MSGQIVTVNKSVYYEVHFPQPVVNSGANPQIVLTASKTEYQMDVLSACTSGSETPVACPSNGGVVVSGPSEVYNGGNIQSWSMDFASVCAANAICQSNLSVVPGTLFVKITRIDIPPPSSGVPYPECDQFRLSLSE